MDQQGEELDRKLLAYLHGELTEEEKKQLLRQLESNEEYSLRLEQLMFENLIEEREEKDIRLDEQEQKAILRRSRWRYRFSNATFTSFMIGVLVFIVFITSQVINYFWFWSASDTMQRTMSDMVQFTTPGVRVAGGGTNGGLFLSINMQYALEERVGRENQRVGTVESKALFQLTNTKMKWNNGQYPISLYFKYPQADMRIEGGRNTAGWSTLEKLPEGTVAQMAISFSHLLTHDQYFEIAKKYELDTLWFAVATGQEQKTNEGGMLSKGNIWGYNVEGLNYGDGITVNGEGERRAKVYMNEMAYLLEQRQWSERIGKQLMYTDPKLEDRYEYMKKNGVKLYGAVITGPTKELLKLKQEVVFTEPYVGRVDWWNWEQAGASGAEFSW